ncbi:hypothetical protein GDO86_009168 [Hymenochirus boettgeri]|uniref:Uncharacterized protein n=1 Tax=Hymenochirus boettgeri TaxID=247094 RepID=A0A8T2JMP2_9PIPI|nr:hypothetical protein GDO86_009168 [Hymenochirus boettgeri]
MGLGTLWKNYKVLIVMGTSLGLVHWGWYSIKSNPIFQPPSEDTVPEPGVVGYVVEKDSFKKGN